MSQAGKPPDVRNLLCALWALADVKEGTGSSSVACVPCVASRHLLALGGGVTSLSLAESRIFELVDKLLRL
jgi:hypothetical protein